MIGTIDLSNSDAVKPHLGVVAILVDEGVYSNPSDYDGLNPEYGNAVPSTTLKGRIDRYAETVQASVPMTKSLIVRVQPDESPENIMNALEKLYFEGDGDEDAITKLNGVILIGNVPIPVVNKSNNRYLSLMPYTDFEDKVYLFNPVSGDFERSPEIKNPQPEVWHGVISPPVSGEAGNELIAEYFDKNHLFRNGFEEFTDFDQKLFYADTIAEKKVLNRTGIEAYERFVGHWEEIAYNRYTTELARNLYEEVNGSLTGADGLDNDGDGKIDEDPINGQDDDNDGIIDEDDGDINYGIDNDGDCWAQSGSLWDTNGDGNPCSTGDNLVDEDGPDDNNNDGDKLRDEDNPGDANGDGCPGECNKDEDGDSEDWDGDGFPNGFEIEVLGSDPAKEKSPTWLNWSFVPPPEQELIESMYVDEVYPTFDPGCFAPAPNGPPALPLLIPFMPPHLFPPFSANPPVVAGSYFNGSLQWNPNGTTRATLNSNGGIVPGIRCGSMSESGSTVNDDDEDGYTDEDTEFDNDADGDGQVDEDRAGNPITESNGDMFSQVPDIQSKKIIESFFKKYPELFKRFVGSLNQWTDFTGRYDSTYLDPNGVRQSDRDTLMGLIGQRDEYAQIVLRSINDVLEDAVDDFVDDNALAVDVPLVGAVTIGPPGGISFLNQDPQGDYTLPVPPPPLIPRTFINFNLKFIPTDVKPLPITVEDFTMSIYGTNGKDINSVAACSLYRGSYDSGGDNQLVEANRVYDYTTAGEWDDREVNGDMVYGGGSHAGCYGNFGETPEYCYAEFSQHPVRSQVGTKLVNDENISVDYRSCYNFRDLASFFGELGDPPASGYFFYSVGPFGILNFYKRVLSDLEDSSGIDPTDDLFIPNLLPADNYRQQYDQNNDGKYNDDDIPFHMANYEAQMQANGMNESAYKHPDDIFLSVPDLIVPNNFLTLGMVFDQLGVNKESQQEVGDFFLTGPNTVNVEFPSDPHIEEAAFSIQRLYVTDPVAPLSGIPPLPFVPAPNNAAALANPAIVRIPSTLKHVEPINSTINAQLSAGFSEALPVDDPRYLTFQDQDGEFTRIDYPNVYNAGSWEELESELEALEDFIFDEVAGTNASSMDGFLTDLLGTEIFQTQVDDTLRWYQMNIDQKHKWTLASYLDPAVETFVGAPDSGYESFYLVAEGEADRVNMSFYANTVEEDEDYEFNHLEPIPDGEPEEIELPIGDEPGTYDLNDPNSNHISWFPFIWIYDMVEWVEDLATTVSNNVAAVAGETADGFGFELACGGLPAFPGAGPDTDHDGIPDSEDGAPYSGDENGDGVSDGADSTVRLSLEWEDDRILYSNGTDRAKLTVRALDSNGAPNIFDAFSVVQLGVTSGDEGVQLVELDGSSIVNGVATIPVIVTKTPGSFTVQAVGVSDNIEGVTSNTLTLQSERKHLKLSTYEKEFFTKETVYRTETLEDVLVLDENDVAVAVIEAANGELRLFNDDDYLVEAVEGTATSPTLLNVLEEGTDRVLATYFVRPDIETLEVETTPGALSGVVNNVRILDRNPTDDWTIEVIEADAILKWGTQLIGLVKTDGRVYLKDGLVTSLQPAAPYSAIDNPHVHVTVNVGESVLFDVVMGTEASLLDISVTPVTPKPLAFTPSPQWAPSLWKSLTTIPRVFAQSTLPDLDGDGLNDLTEWTIGTDIEKTDTDGDSYSDSTELENGFNPTVPNARLFTDLLPDHEAYEDVILLYTRGIASGYPDGSFRPEDSITREEFTKLNLGAVCVDCTAFATSVREDIEREYEPHPFPDTNIDPNLFYCVAHSRNEDLISGYKGGEFASYYLPKNTMSRAEASKVLLETVGISVPDVSDMSAPWYMNYVIAAQSRHLYPPGRFNELDGGSGDTFDLWFARELIQNGSIKTWLESPITRGEFAMMVGNLTRIQDCRAVDTDGDGLPDQAEIYNFGTNPFNPDTDYGGVNDYIEVVNNQNAISDPTDDYGDVTPPTETDTDDNEVIEDDEDIEVIAPPQADTDSDGDGISDIEESVLGTDPFDADSDDGGVSDFEEILAGTDPLDALEEADELDRDDGAHVAGLHLSRDSVYAVDQAEVIFESKQFTKIIPADGASQLFLRAEMIDENGLPDHTDNSTIVEFVAVDPINPYADILRAQVRMSDGVAETELLASTTSGYYDITASISPVKLPIVDTTLHVYPGVPFTIDLASDLNFLKTGGLNKTTIDLTLRDQYDNVAYMDPYDVTLSVNGPGSIDYKDDDTEQAGIQTTVYEGKMSFDLISGEEEGTATVLARVGDVDGTLPISVYDNIALELHPNNTELTANGVTQTTIEVWAVLNNSGAPLSDFNGVVDVSLLDELYGSFAGPTRVRMEDGKASVDFVSSTVAGDAYLTATMVGFDPSTLPLKLLPGPAYYLEVSSTSDVVTISDPAEAAEPLALESRPLIVQWIETAQAAREETEELDDSISAAQTLLSESMTENAEEIASRANDAYTAALEAARGAIEATRADPEGLAANFAAASVLSARDAFAAFQSAEAALNMVSDAMKGLEEQVFFALEALAAGDNAAAETAMDLAADFIEIAHTNFNSIQTYTTQAADAAQVAVTNAENAGVIVAFVYEDYAPPTSSFLGGDAEVFGLGDGPTDTTLSLGPPGTVEVQVKAHDAYGNFVDTDFSTPIGLRVTPHTSRFGAVDLANGVLSAGMAIFQVSARDLTGPVNLVASSPGLRYGAHTINSVLEVAGPEFADIEPDVLFGTLLGAPFGDVTKEDYVAGWFTFSGTTQASLSLLSEPEPSRRLAAMDSQGKLSVLDGNAVDVSILPSNSSTLPSRFFVKDLLSKQTVVEGVVVPSNSDFYILNLDDDLKAVQNEGMYVQPVLEHSRYELRESKSNVSLLENKNEIVRLQPNGQIQLYDPNYSLEVNEEYDGLSFDVMLGGASVIRVLWKQTFTEDVTQLDNHFEWEDWTSLSPGVYFMGVDSSMYGYETSYSGNSSYNATGMFVVDKTEGLPSNQKPGLGRNSLESAQNSPGVGFDGDNKFMLALTDGMMVGESHQFYASDIGIVLGDPTIRLTDANPQEISATGFTSGVGRLILSGSETIQDVSATDYNSDGLTDILVAFENGVVDLLENTDSYPRFNNKGSLLNFSNGLIDMTENDFNQDGQTDLVVATAEACVQGEVCIYQYTNHDANFIRKNLELEIDGSTIKQIESEDLNQDDYPDLIISDLNGSILVFYNDKGTIRPQGDLLGNLGLKVDDTAELIEEVMINYTGMPEESGSSQSDDGWFKEFPLPAEEGFGNTEQKFSAEPIKGLPTGGFEPGILGDLVANTRNQSNPSIITTIDEPRITNNVTFVYADIDDDFAASTKTGVDVNGGIVKDGDRLEYTVRLANGGTSTIDDLAFTDVVSTMLDLNWGSIGCDDSPGASCDQAVVSKTGMSVRPFMVSGLILEPGSFVEVSYSATVAGVSIPKVKIFMGQDLDPTYPDDDYIDIAASPEDNPTGQLVFFYSNGTYQEDGLRKVNYTKQTSQPEPPPKTDFFSDLGIDFDQDDDDDGIPDMLQGNSDTGPPAIATDLYEQQTSQDKDGDGLNNLWDDMNGNFNPQDVMTNVDAGFTMVGDIVGMVGDTMETLMSQMLCSGGCIASPINFAFLVPGPINVMGIPSVPMDMAHIPVFGAPASGIPFVWPPLPWQGTSAVRIYVSITTTLGFTMSVCVGSYLSGQCWSFAIPLFEALGICDAINGALSDVMSKASSAISSGMNMLMSFGGAIPGGSAGGRSESGGLINYDLGSYSVSADSGSGSRVPGFPKPFAEWLRKQSEEVVNKLTDLPDIYFYYPDPQSIVGAFKPQNVDKIDSADLRGLEKILTVLNSFPILKIETEEVQFKIPAITNDEIEKVKNDATQWLDDMKDQWAAKKPNWEKPEFDKPEYAASIQEIEQLMANVEKNLETLEDYRQFPKKLLKWRNAESYYIKQIICYLDAIINNLVGWVVINKGRVEQWIAAFYDTKEALKSWKKIFQLALDYQSSCDQCTNDRMSLFELISKLFVFIPEPPIIEIPRWPDIVFDLSQIQAGLTVVWPEIRFEQQPILIPKLPRFTIPDVPPVPRTPSVPSTPELPGVPGQSGLNLPTIPLLPELPDLPDLPELPGIPIPELPDLPPPPKIPELPEPVQVTLGIVSGVIKILCLIQSGIVPTAETSLKTSIEDMTQRPLDPPMPFDLGGGFQAPPISIDFVDQIEIITHINLALNFDGIVRAVEMAADASSDLVTDLVGLANEGLTTAVDLAEEGVNAGLDAATDAANEAVDLANEALEEAEALLEEGVDAAEELLDEAEALLDDAEELVEEVVDESTDVAPDGLDSPLSLKQRDMHDMLVANEALQMIDNPYVQPFIEEWTQSVKDLEALALAQAEINKDVPEVHHLTARQGYLSFTSKEINQRFDEIQGRYYAGSLTDLDSSPLNGLRNELIASFSDHQNGNRALASLVENDEDANWDDVNRWIAEINQQESNFSGSTYLASSQENGNTVYGSDSVFEKMREWVVDEFSTTEANPFDSELEDLDESSQRYLVDTSNGFGNGGAASPSEPVLTNKGLFIYNSVAAVNERLVEYTGEADSDESHLVFVDMDNDRDEDIVYGYGANLYIKENFNRNEPLDHYEEPPSIVNLEDLLPEAPAVNLYRTKDNGNRTAAATWKQSYDNILGYEVKRFDALPNFESDDPSQSHWGTFLSPSDPLVPTLSDLRGDAVEDIALSMVLPGNALESEEDKLRMDFEFPSGDGRVTAEKNTSFFVPDFEVGETILLDIGNHALLPDGELIHNLVKSGSVEVSPGDLIHTVRDATVVLTFSDSDGEVEFDLPENTQFRIASGYTGTLTMDVDSGWVEVIGDSISDDPQVAFEGMIILEGERVVYDRSITVTNQSNQGYTETEYDGAGDFEWHALPNDSAPTLDLALENGDYYSQIRSILADGRRGTWGETQLFSPQICADDGLPYPNIGAANQRVSVFKTLTLDGSGSFDTDSEITTYYWDIDLEVDTDDDGDPTNDKNAHHDTNPLVDADGDGSKANDWDDPTLEVGPWDTPGERPFKLWVGDEAGHVAGAVVNVNAFVPDITLNASSGRTGVVEGSISTSAEGIPFVLARERNGIFELISTPAATENDKYFTVNEGRFEITDLELTEEWAIYNSLDEEVATVNLDTGQLSLTESGYTVEVRSAELPWPTRVALIDPSGFELLYIIMVPDSNVDVKIDTTVKYTTDTVASMRGVHVKPVDMPADLHLEKVPSNAPLFTGGVMLVDKNNTRWAVIDTDGNIYQLSDTDLEVKNLSSVNATADQDGAAPIVLTLGEEENVWMEIFISPRAKDGETHFLNAEDLGLDRGVETYLDFSSEDLDGLDSDEDGISDLDELRAGLNPFDAQDANQDSDGDHLSNAEEFVQGTNPNSADSDGDGLDDFDELKRGTDPNLNDASYFTDIPVNDPLYDKLYQFVQLDMIDGFPTAEGTAFKPDQLITRAEYTKVLLAMLCIDPRAEAYQSPNVFYDILYTQEQDLPWYYPITKESYLQGFIYGYLGELNEAGMSPFKPNQPINRAEGAKIILEALETLGALDLSSVQVGNPWYEPYMDVAQNLDPYLVSFTGGEGQTFIITPEEAANPGEALSRYDFMLMASRVLSAVNCFAARDSDGDGISDYDEVTVYGTDPFSQDTDNGGLLDGEEIENGDDPLDRRDDDSDGDGLINNDEIDVYGTDPFDPDTDHGGVNDGDEILQGTEPYSTPEDDYPATASDSGDDGDTGDITEETLEDSILEEDNAVSDVDPGLYIVTFECNSCPCDLTVENSADIASGDTIFAAIMDAANSVILSISNKVEVGDIFAPTP
jgi:hypothetical protein